MRFPDFPVSTFQRSHVINGNWCILIKYYNTVFITMAERAMHLFQSPNLCAFGYIFVRYQWYVPFHRHPHYH